MSAPSHRLYSLALLLAAAPALLRGQWLDYPTAGVPRTPDGKPNLTAPAPRLADGKPALSGMWGWETRTNCGSKCTDTEIPREFIDIAAGLKTPVPFQPWAAELVKERRVKQGLDPNVRCMPRGAPRIWTDDYNFINTRGVLVTRAQRLANFASGATDIAVIDNERETTVSVYGDVAVVQNFSTLRGQFSGQPADTDLRGMFVWIHSNGRWQLATNELTAVVP